MCTAISRVALSLRTNTPYRIQCAAGDLAFTILSYTTVVNMAGAGAKQIYYLFALCVRIRSKLNASQLIHSIEKKIFFIFAAYKTESVS